MVIICVWHIRYLEDGRHKRIFLVNLNILVPSIEFTIEVEKGSNCFKTAYTKSNHTGLFLDFQLIHSDSTEKGIMEIQKKPTDVVKSEIQILKMDLLRNGYPENLIDRTGEKCQSIEKIVEITKPLRTMMLILLNSFSQKHWNSLHTIK